MLPDEHYNENILSIDSNVQGLKGVLSIFVFVWIRAIVPRMLDSLREFYWTHMPPVVICTNIEMTQIINSRRLNSQE